MGPLGEMILLKVSVKFKLYDQDKENRDHRSVDNTSKDDINPNFLE